MLGFLGAPAGFGVGGGGLNVTPGSQLFTANGNFTIPVFNTITFHLNGGGGGGGGFNGANDVQGTDGSDTTVTTLSLTAGGGKGSLTRTGGTASGGTTNTPGQSGGAAFNGLGGASYGPQGGASQAAPGSGNGGNGNNYGGGGAGANADALSYQYPGGGGGGYCSKSYSAGDLTPGDIIGIAVGLEGTGGGSTPKGGDGARGSVFVEWS